MRDLFFRGKDLETGEWAYGNLIIRKGEVSDNNHYFIVHTRKGVYRREENKVYPESIGQDTGLKDRNGEPVYEGDILKMSGGSVFACSWDKHNACFILSNETPGLLKTSTSMANLGGCEVIGKIYDRPELLGEGNK